MTVASLNRYHAVIDDMCDLKWSALNREELVAVCAAYYYFSVQFIEAVDIACGLYPWGLTASSPNSEEGNATLPTLARTRTSPRTEDEKNGP